MEFDKNDEKIIKKAKFVFRFCKSGTIKELWFNSDNTSEEIVFSYELETDFDKLKRVLYFENDTEGAIVTPNLLITNIKLFANGKSYKTLKQTEDYDYHRLFVFITHQMHKIFTKFKAEVRFFQEHKRPIQVFEK